MLSFFPVVYLKEELRWNYLVGFLLMVIAVFLRNGNQGRLVLFYKIFDFREQFFNFERFSQVIIRAGYSFL